MKIYLYCKILYRIPWYFKLNDDIGPLSVALLPTKGMISGSLKNSHDQEAIWSC